MKIDIERAFTYVKNDPQVVKKFVIGSCLGIFAALIEVVKLFMPDTQGVKLTPEQTSVLFLMISVVLVLMVLGIVCSLFLTGYFIKNANIRIKNPDSLLPDWKAWYFVTGLKATIAVLFYIIVAVIIALGVPFLFNILFHSRPVTAILSIIVYIPLFLALIVIINLASISFVVDLKFESFFNFSRMKLIYKENIGQFFLYIVLTLGLSFLVSLASGILTLTVIGIIAIPVLNFYQFLVVSDLLAQLVRTAPHFKEITGQEI